MKLLRGLVGWGAFLLALLCAATAVGLLVLERTGHLTDLVRRQLADALALDVSRIQVERASLTWFRPGVHLYGVRVEAEGPGHIALDAVHLDVGPGGESSEVLRGLRIDGGDVLYSPNLVHALRRRLEEPTDPTPATQPHLPPIHIYDLAFAVHTPDAAGGLPIGELDFTIQRDGHDLLTAQGRLEPQFVEGEPSTNSAIHFLGEEYPKNRFRVFASTRDLPIGAGELPFELASRLAGGKIPEGLVDGRMTLFGQGTFRLDGRGPTEAHLRVEVADGRVDFGAGAPAIESLVTDVDLSYRAEPGQTYLHLPAWDLVAHTRGEWLDGPVDAWVTVGKSAGPGYAAAVWGHVPTFPLTEEVFDLIPEPGTSKAMEALEPRGVADARFAVRVPWIHDAPVFPPEVLLHMGLDGGASLRVIGWENLVTGVREGVPIPISDIHGRYVLAGRRGAPLGSPLGPPFDWRSGIVDVTGRPGSGSVRARGTVGAPKGIGHAFLNLWIELDDLPIDENLRAGLDGLVATREIWNTYRPSTGRLDARWRMLRDQTTGGLAHMGDFTFREAGLSWTELPIPAKDVDGELHLRWARPDGARTLPLGVTYRATGATDTVESVSLRGSVRDDMEPGAPARTSPRRIQSMEVTAASMPLKGSDWNVLRARFPEVTAEVETFSPRGKADVAYRAWDTTLGPSSQIAVEVTPVELNIQPRQFQMRAEAVRGRVLATSTLPAGGPSPESPARFETHIALAGKWSGDVAVAARGSLSSVGGGTVRAWGAGVDPSNVALRGALAEATDNDMSALAVDGRVDFHSVFPVPAVGETAAAAATHRIFLHGNDLAIREFGLNSLRGMLIVRDGVLHGPVLDARVADTPVELRDTYFAGSADIISVPGADPLLAEPGVLPETPASVLQADLYAKDLPLDREHLNSIARNSTGIERVMTDQSWRGQVDLEGTRLILVQEESGRFKTAIRGEMLLHGISFDPGLPVVIPSARVDLRGLFVESGRVRGWAELSDLYARVADRELSRARALVSYIDGRLTLDNLSGAFEGGRIHSLGTEQASSTALRLDLQEPFGFDFTLALEDVQIGELLEGMFHSGVSDTGALEGQLRLAGSLQDPLGLRGEGSVRIGGARLWSIPVIRELFSQLGFDGSAVFDRMSGQFRIRDGQVRFSEVRARSPILKLVGYDGILDLDGRLDFDLEVRYSLIDKLGPLTRLLYWVQNSLLRVAIRGDMSRPRVILRNAVSEFFGGENLEDRQLPLPDFTSVPDRF